MADVKRYGVNWFGELDLVVEVDHDVVTNDTLTEINTFWSDADERLDDADGNVLVAVLKMLGQQCWELMIAHNFNTYGLIQEFRDREGGHAWTDPKVSKSLTATS
ncbi:DUF2528 family protein [Pectobacterium aroidearum]|uniref:DUF2528 family protein n=1 Tax=Pectobacterium aroidearum TaxID=1201031 RepID=UPI0021138ED5|nr:DUF2528 family protein [Pectobacterium aroidearum]UUE75516.1 DUF2528 family protein [Pectobacterium aroidearum]UUE75896.1 DUF2528 family protein [Pectobacterium aroidearum]